MGQVYEARGPDGETVALKVLRGGASAGAREKEMFSREARVGLRLHHPGLVEVLEVSEDNGHPYLVMEYLPGPTLRELRESGALSLQSVLALAFPVLEALDYLQNEGVVHRDLKSGNIMLDREGRPRLMDFGLTRFSDETSLTQTGLIFGSPHYMSPEQGMGETLSEASDLFSFGVVLYELITGRLPFRGDHPVGVVYAIINEEPESIRRIRPELPEALSWILSRAMAKRPADRYESAAEFSADLLALKEHLEGRISAEALHLKARPPEARSVDRLRLAGRDRELQSLCEWIETPPGASLLYLSGEAGIGKTRLVREAISRLGERAPKILVGRTQPGRESFPYQPWREALRPELLDRKLLEAGRFEELLREHPGRERLSQILRAFFQGEKGEADDREQLFEALRVFFKSLSRETDFRFWFEDFHRADHASLDLLTFLSRSPEPPFCMVSYRTEELEEGSLLRNLIRELDREGRCRSISLERLGEEELGRLVEDVLPGSSEDPRIASRLFRESRGNPFILGELLGILERGNYETGGDPEDWDLPLPDRLQDLVGLRLSSLSEEDRDLLDLAAVEGEAFQADTLAAVLGKRKIHVLRQLQKIQRGSGVLRAAEGRFLFDHALVHRVLYESLSPDLCREYHRMVGEHIEEHRSARADSSAAVARHYMAAGEARRALPFLLAAGRVARGLYANYEARRQLEPALEIAELWWLEEPLSEASTLRREVLQELGELEATEGNYDSSEKLLSQSRSLLVPGIEDSLQPELRRLRGESLFFAGRKEEASAELSAALSACEEGQNRERALILRSLARLESTQNRWEKALQTCEEARELEGLSASESLALKHTMGLIQMSRGDLDEAQRVFSEVIREASLAEEESLHAASLANQGIVHWRKGRAREAVESLEESLVIRRRMGTLTEIARSLVNLAIIRTKQGSLGEARSLLEESQSMKRRIGDADSLAHGENALGNLENTDGRLEKAIEHYRTAAELHFQSENRAGAAVALHNQGETLLDMGCVEEARPLLDRALDLREDLQLRTGRASSWRARARLLAALGDEEEARAAFSKARRIAADEPGTMERLKVELEVLGFLCDLKEVSEARKQLEELRKSLSSWPPEGLSFEFRFLDLRLLRAEGKEKAETLFRELLSGFPSTENPYQRCLLLHYWSKGDSDTAEGSEARELAGRHGYHWLSGD
jgi:serine/threonine protein kinase